MSRRAALLHSGTRRIAPSAERVRPNGTGHPLEPAVRTAMEARFGTDFSAVRVHDDAHAHAQATAHLARAFTVGHDIVFGAGRYAPASHEGRRLLAHELAHVVQQTRLPTQSASSEHAEAEADAAGHTVAAGGQADVQTGANVGVQCEPLTAEEIQRLTPQELEARLAANQRESAPMVLTEEHYERLAEERRLLNQAYARAKGIGTPPDKTETGRPLDPGDAMRYAVKGIHLYVAAEVPYTDGTGPFRPETVGDFVLGPNAIQCENGDYAVLYYVAYSKNEKVNRWVVGPDSVQKFKANPESRTLDEKTEDRVFVPGQPTTIPLQAETARQQQVKGIKAHYLTESVPQTSKKAPQPRVAAGPYDLVPHQAVTALGDTVTMYYTARDRKTGFDQYVIGPDALEEFKRNAVTYHNAVALAYAAGPPHKYESESVKWVNAAMAGEWSEAFGHLGNAWGAAVKDPKWQLQAAAAHIPVHRAIAPVAQYVKRRATPVIAATMIGLESGAPAVTLGTAPKAVIQVVEQTAAAETRQVGTAAVSQAVKAEAPQLAAQGIREAAPVVAPAAQGGVAAAAPGVTSQVVGMGVQATLQPQVAAQAARIPDADIDAAVERAFVEYHTVTTAPAPRPALRRVTRTQEAVETRVGFGTLRPDYAEALSVAAWGQVHHAIEVQVLSRYPGAFTPGEINAFGNMRGIPPELNRRTQLHNSKIREILDRHYRALDDEIARRGLLPGTPEYNALVRSWLTEARAEIDYVLGQFFSEQRAMMFAPAVTP